MAREPSQAAEEVVDAPEDDEVESGPDADVEDADDQAGNDEIDADAGEKDAAGADEGQAGGPGEVKRKGASDVIRELRERSQRAERLAEEERQARIRAEAAAEARRQNESEEAERQRLALMTPEEKSDHYRRKDREENDRRFNALQFQSLDATDRAEYRAMATVNPVYAKHQAEVEKRLGELRSKGQNVSREVLLKFIIGERALEKAPQAAGRQRAKAGERVARETVRTTNSRGDTRVERRPGDNTAEARKRRLEDQQI